MHRHHVIDGVKVPFTEAEELQRDKEEIEWELGQADRDKDKAHGRLCAELPRVEDMLITIIKQLNYMQLNKETNLIGEMDDLVGKYLSAHKKHKLEK